MGETSLSPGALKRQRKARHTHVWVTAALLIFANGLITAYHFEVLPVPWETAGPQVPGEGTGQGGLDEGGSAGYRKAKSKRVKASKAKIQVQGADGARPYGAGSVCQRAVCGHGRVWHAFVVY